MCLLNQNLTRDAGFPGRNSPLVPLIPQKRHRIVGDTTLEFVRDVLSLLGEGGAAAAPFLRPSLPGRAVRFNQRVNIWTTFPVLLADRDILQGSHRAPAMAEHLSEGGPHDANNANSPNCLALRNRQNPS